MTRVQYAGIPENSPSPFVSTISGVGAVSAEVGEKFFWLQCRNRAGYNLPSAIPVSVIVEAGDLVEVTIPASVLPNSDEAVDLVEVLILMGSSSAIESASIVASFPGYEADGVTNRSFPAIVQLYQDNHLKLAATVPTNADLPIEAVHGMLRQVDETGQILSYSAISSSWIPVVPQLFNPLVYNTTSGIGCNADIKFVPEANFLRVAYLCEQDSSVPIRYWLVNDSDYAIAAGTPVELLVSIRNQGSLVYEGISTLIREQAGIDIAFLGYVNAETGERDATGAGGGGTMAGIGAYFQYPGVDTGLVLPKDLEPGMGYVLSARMNMQAYQFEGNATDYSEIRLRPKISTRRARLQPGAEIFGSFVLSEGGSRRIVPNGDLPLTALALSGRGSIIIESGDSFGFQAKNPSPVYLLEANTDDQKCWLIGNGDLLINETRPSLGQLRAYLGTVDGVGHSTGWIGSVELSAAQQLSLTFNLPTAIRSDYPDVNAGMIASFNGFNLVIYLRSQSGGNVFTYEVPFEIGSQQQTVLLNGSGGVDAGNTDLPANPSNDFGLFEISAEDVTALTEVEGISSFATDIYDLAIAIRYADTLTRTSHDYQAGCLFEASGTFADLFAGYFAWAESCLTVTTMRSLSVGVVKNGQTRWLLSDQKGQKSIYLYDGQSVLEDDGYNVIKLTGNSVSGRFLRVFSFKADFWQAPLFGDPAANFPALRSLELEEIRDNQIRYVVADQDGIGAFFAFKSDLEDEDDGADIIKPTAVVGSGAYKRIAGSGGKIAVGSGGPTNPPTLVGQAYYQRQGVLWVAIASESADDWQIAGFKPDLVVTQGDQVIVQNGSIVLGV